MNSPLVLLKDELPQEHRENMMYVMDELLCVTNYTTCDNENCETELHKHHNTGVYETIMDREYYFCCEGCASYGIWSIRYDARKRNRLERSRVIAA